MKIDKNRPMACHENRSGAAEAGNLGERRLSAEDVRRLYDQHGPALVAYACTFVTDGAAAEDVVHQVFLRLLSTEVAMPDVPVAYVYRAVRNAALNARRSGLRNTPLDPESSIFEHRGGNREAALALQKVLAELPEEQREAVVMRVWSGLTLEEVAAATGAPLNTAASRYRYALEKLREKLQPYRRK
jgi:RNA polymerase sigma-70 factor, ECF subfamily